MERRNVPGEGAGARERPAGDVRFDDPALLDGHAVLGVELSAHGSVHDDVFVGRDLAFDGDACADDRACHVESPWLLLSTRLLAKDAALVNGRVYRRRPEAVPPA